MKCKNCGANYKTRELKCPYCGTENMVGRIWLMERDDVSREYEETKEKVRKKSRLYVADKVLNRILLILVLFSCCFFLLAAAAVGLGSLYGKIYRQVHREELQRTMEEYYQAGEYKELYDYMSKYQMFGQETYQYSQAAFMGFDYDNFKSNSLSFLSQDEEKKQEDHYLLEYTLRCAHRVWHLDMGMFSELDSGNEMILKENKIDVLAFFRGMLGMTEEEISILTDNEDFPDTEVLEELVEGIMERRSWL